MNVDPKDIGALRSVRRMEIKSKAQFCDGFYTEIGPAVLSASETIPDPHFNRISILEPDKFDQSLLTECTGHMVEGTPIFIDIPHPVSEKIRDILLRNGYRHTGESRSSMLLTDHDDAYKSVDGLGIECVETETAGVFIDLFLRGFETPEDIIPLAKSILHDLVLRTCHHESFRVYLGMFRGEPACTEYLFFEGEEGGVNMVSTKENLRGKGLATAMVRRLIEDAKSLGIRLLSLESRWNSAPERLYSKLGFTTIERHEVFTNIPDLKYGL